jgi:outer membrane receptor protein involved in Fe transport
MVRTSFARVSLIALTAILAAAPHAAFAQDAEAPAAEDDSFGNQIIVTAQKRAESIEDVPLTVSALTGENLRTVGVDEFDEVAAYIPGLVVQEQSVNNPGFVIRGITSDSGSAQIAPRVTIYYNGVDVSRSRGSYFDLFDIERIEVVKGPQATLFGTASTIGAVSVVTARPKPGVEAFASASYGNFDAYQFNGMVNVGSDTAGARIAGVFKKRDGFVTNIAGLPGTTSATTVGVRQDDLNGYEQWGVRGSVRVAPYDDATIDLIVTYEKQDNPGTAFVSGTIPSSNVAGGGTTSPFRPVELGGSRLSALQLGSPRLGIERDVFDMSLQMEFPLGSGLTYTSVTGYREFDSLEIFDADGTGLYYLEFAEDAQGDQFSHESRVSYESDMFRGFLGVNYFREEGTQAVPFSTDEGTYISCAPFPAFGAVRNVIAGGLGVPVNQLCSGSNALLNAPRASRVLTGGASSLIPYSSIFTNGGTNKSFSVFLDGTVVLGSFELTAGVRYITEDRTSTYIARQPGSTVFAGLGVPGVSLLGAVDTRGQTFSAQDDFDAWLPRFNALFRVTDAINVYGTISKGRRSPVLNLTARTVAGAPQPNLTRIAEETVWNYEGGIKGALGDFSGSVGVFYQEYTNFQVSLPVAGQNGQITQPFNAGKADNFGVEVEAAYAPSRFIRLFANYAYIDAKIGRPADATATTVFVGSRFRLQPDHKASGGIDVTVPLGDSGIELFATPSVTYQSRVFFEQPNTALISQDGYTLVNLRAGVRFADGKYQITGFARNLTDEEYLIDAGNTGGAFGTPTFIPGEPRLYGVEVSARF